MQIVIMQLVKNEGKQMIKGIIKELSVRILLNEKDWDKVHRKKGKSMNEEFEKMEECNVLQEIGKILKINIMSRKNF